MSRQRTSPPMSNREFGAGSSAAVADPAPVFAALGDATRLALVSRLGDGKPRSIVQLTEGVGITRQGVTKHLRILERAGIVMSVRVGRESRFVFDPGAIVEARDYLDRASKQWEHAIARLKALVEEE